MARRNIDFTERSQFTCSQQAKRVGSVPRTVNLPNEANSPGPRAAPRKWKRRKSDPERLVASLRRLQIKHYQSHRQKRRAREAAAICIDEQGARQRARPPPHSAAMRAAAMACHTRAGVAGMSICFTPNGFSASRMALMMAGGAPTVPASPQPLTPKGLVLHASSL